jgi:hypothetical protein
MGEVQIEPHARAAKPFQFRVGFALSDAVDVEGYDPVALQLPAAWGTANITFLAAEKFDGTYSSVYGPTGVEAMATVGTSTRVILLTQTTLADIRGLRYMKLRSGTEATQVPVAADRVVNMLVRQGA